MTFPDWVGWCLAGLYLLVALVCVAQALLDRFACGEAWTGLRIGGLGLCLVWPLTLLGIALWMMATRGKGVLQTVAGAAPDAVAARFSRRWRS
ncbi:hypothetical protein [Rhizobium sp. CSW-27]|uniref:hypothetical protein n=1 Tax=Rhizobium sp. CSW-27 TaxID=2839985 RepID=UPI001C01F878|nr:hypothetical protein [Rhizobium sp. CSW-27]MBT9368362.1 hypothetical protein [Rhizobium sp. CSW-27]